MARSSYAGRARAQRLAKKTHPARHFYAAAALALLFGVGQLSMGSWIHGAIFTVAGVAFGAYGVTHRARPAPAMQP